MKIYRRGLRRARRRPGRARAPLEVGAVERRDGFPWSVLLLGGLGAIGVYALAKKDKPNPSEEDKLRAADYAQVEFDLSKGISPYMMAEGLAFGHSYSPGGKPDHEPDSYAIVEAVNADWSPSTWRVVDLTAKDMKAGNL